MPLAGRGAFGTRSSGPSHLRELSLQTLEDPGRLFLTSQFVHLEVLPKAIFNKQAAETRSYERFFARAMVARDLKTILSLGEKAAAHSGVGVMDSLHLAPPIY